MPKNGTISEVVHAWAHQHEDGPFQTPNESIWWDGKTIYSYGRHFPMATFRDDIPGISVVVNNGRYSNSTCKHQNAVYSALGYDRDDILRISEGSDSSIVRIAEWAFYEYQKIVDELPSKRVGAGPYNSLLSQWQRMIDIQTKLPTFPEHARVPPISDDLEGELAEAREQEKAKRKEELKQLRAEMVGDLEKWRRYEGSDTYHRHKTQHLRISRDGTQAETTSGVRFPIEHAKASWKRIKQFYETGRELPPIRFGHFRLDNITSDGTLVAGCHRIKKTEVYRFAEELGL